MTVEDSSQTEEEFYENLDKNWRIICLSNLTAEDLKKLPTLDTFFIDITTEKGGRYLLLHLNTDSNFGPRILVGKRGESKEAVEGELENVRDEVWREVGGTFIETGYGTEILLEQKEFTPETAAELVERYSEIFPSTKITDVIYFGPKTTKEELGLSEQAKIVSR